MKQFYARCILVVGFNGNKFALISISDCVMVFHKAGGVYNDYEKSHPNITINLDAVTGNDFGASLKAKMQSDPPTIFSVSTFQDLKDYSSELADVSDIPVLKYAEKGATDMFAKDGNIYAVPLYMEGYGFVINRKIFEDAGVSFHSMLTFDGMKAGFDTLKAKIANGSMKAKYPELEAVMEYPTKELWIAGDHDANVALTHDFSTPNQAYASATLPGTGFAGYKKMVDFQASYTTNAKDTAKLNSIDYTTSLGGGLCIERVAALKQGNWIAPAVETANKSLLKDLDMLPYSVPSYSDGKYFAGVSGYWAVGSKASEKQQKAAKDFINWMYSSSEGQKLSRRIVILLRLTQTLIIWNPAIHSLNVWKKPLKPATHLMALFTAGHHRPGDSRQLALKFKNI